MSKEGAVWMSAALAYLTEEMLTLAAEEAGAEKRNVIEAVDLGKVMKEDRELNELTKKVLFTGR